jgi:hypothetical protein
MFNLLVVFASMNYQYTMGMIMTEQWLQTLTE